MSDDPIGTSNCVAIERVAPESTWVFRCSTPARVFFRRLARLDANSLPVSRAYVSPGSHTYQKYHRPLTAVGQTLGESYWFSLRQAVHFLGHHGSKLLWFKDFRPPRPRQQPIADFFETDWWLPRSVS